MFTHSAGTLANAGNATYVAGMGSVSYFPAGFDPRAAFKSFSTQGIWHTAGTTLVVPAGFILTLQKGRLDLTEIRGVVRSGGGALAFGTHGFNVKPTGSIDVTGGALSIGAESTVAGGLVTAPSLAVASARIDDPADPAQWAPTLSLTSGTVTVAGAMTVATGYKAHGLHEVTGGSLSAASLTVGERIWVSYGPPVDGIGVYRQTGGQAQFGTITLDGNGNAAAAAAPYNSGFQLRGGVVRVATRFTATGAATVDFGGGDGAFMAADGAVIDWEKATVANARNTAYTAGALSQSYFPKGFNPYTDFAAFSSLGLVHTRDTRIVIPVGQPVSVQQLVGSSVEVAGDLEVRAGGSIEAASLDVAAGGVVRGSGALAVADVTSAGTLRPGASPGTLALSGNFTQSAAGTLEVEIAGLNAGAQHDRVTVAQNAALGGALHLSLLDGYQPAAGNQFRILTAAARTGTFATVTGTDVAPGLDLSVHYTPTAVDLIAGRWTDADIAGVFDVPTSLTIDGAFVWDELLVKTGDGTLTLDLDHGFTTASGAALVILDGTVTLHSDTGGHVLILSGLQFGDLGQFSEAAGMDLNGKFGWSYTPAVVPEPAAATLILTCLGAASARRRRRRT